MNKKTMLHHLRNPYGIDETETREARLQAADELERFYVFVEKVKNILLAMQEAKNDSVESICLECSICPCMCEVHG